MAVFQQFAFATQKAIYHFSNRREISFQNNQFFTQMCNIGKRPGISPSGHLFFYLFNMVAQFFHYYKIVVNYHVKQCITTVSYTHLDVYKRQIYNRPGCPC